MPWSTFSFSFGVGENTSKYACKKWIANLSMIDIFTLKYENQYNFCGYFSNEKAIQNPSLFDNAWSLIGNCYPRYFGVMARPHLTVMKLLNCCWLKTWIQLQRDKEAYHTKQAYQVVYMRPFARFDTIIIILKTWKTPMEECYL